MLWFAWSASLSTALIWCMAERGWQEQGAKTGPAGFSPSICSILPCRFFFFFFSGEAKTVMGELLPWQAAVSQEELGGAWQLDGPCICFGPHEHGAVPTAPSWWDPRGDADCVRVSGFAE